MFCGGHFEFLIRARCASARSGAEITEVWDGRENSQILGGSRSLTEDNKVTRDETSDWLSSYVSASWGERKYDVKERPGSQNAGFVVS